jgi:dGTPase
MKLEDVRPVRPEISDDQLRTALATVAEVIRNTHPVSRVFDGSRKLRVELRSLTSFLIKRYFNAISLTEDPQRSVLLDEDLECEVAMLKQLTWHCVINRPSLGVQQLGQRRVIRDLFCAYVEAAGTPLSR